MQKSLAVENREVDLLIQAFQQLADTFKLKFGKAVDDLVDMFIVPYLGYILGTLVLASNKCAKEDRIPACVEAACNSGAAMEEDKFAYQSVGTCATTGALSSPSY
jgi:hypothetical protein